MSQKSQSLNSSRQLPKNKRDEAVTVSAASSAEVVPRVRGEEVFSSRVQSLNQGAVAEIDDQSFSSSSSESHSEADENIPSQSQVSHSSQSSEQKSESRCQFSHKDLQKDGLKLRDVCPLCRWIVHEHFTPVEKESSSSSGRMIKDALLILEKQNCSWPVQHSTSKAESSSKMFFQRLEMLLRYSISDSQFFIRLLPLIIKDERSKIWVDENIVQIQPALTWTEAKKKFGDFFDSRSLEEDLRTEFRSLVQLSNESVQTFAEKFTHYVRALDMNDEKFIISEFKVRLRREVQTELARSINFIPGGESEFYRIHNKLDLFIQKCIEVSRITSAVNRAAGHSDSDQEYQNRRPRRIVKKRSATPNSSDSAKKSRTNLTCSLHGEGNHTTEECRTLIRRASRQAKTVSEAQHDQQIQRERKLTPPTNYVCHTCNQSGHWKHECPQKPNEPAKSSPSPPGHAKPKANALALRSSNPPTDAGADSDSM